MVAWTVSVLSGMLNLIGSFSTDGMWKTAGMPLSQLYWTWVARDRKSARGLASTVCFP